MDYYFDNSKSLSELEGKKIGKPGFDSHLVQTCHELYSKPICNFSIEDLRIMVGQNIGLLYLIPLAIEELKLNPLASGDLYGGDLLNSVINSDKLFWEDHPKLKAEVISILEGTIDRLKKGLIEFQGT